MNDVIISLFASAGYDRAAQGVAGAGRRLAADCGAQLHAVIIGAPDAAMKAAVAAVADAVTIADIGDYQTEICLSALTQICKTLAPQAVLLSNDFYSQELAPRLAHRLGGSAVADGLALNLVEGKVRVNRSVYGGKAMATIELQRSPAVVWLRARAFDPAPLRPEATTAIQPATLDLPTRVSTTIIERKVEAGDEARLEDAKVIVSGGRGLGSPEPFNELQKLANILGAQMAASRAACDAGWVPPSWQVGQTGKKVAPGLYLAVAIHGASQHLAGISDAKNIAAINIDKDAPIFKQCRFGIVEDYRKVVPLLIARLNALKK
ncbi:MAG: electron transfer flavoprotein subunit alpha/FixB family protein [Acidobacteria bacterium]|nr:electron transfer flavoprotein subunit alpha/FixB family protein [Acidobacteriota bacterium]